MHPELRHALRTYYNRLAEINGVDDASKLFTVDPSVQQRLETRIQEHAEFLSRINMVGVREMEGDKVGDPTPSPTRYDGGAALQPHAAHSLDARRYRCRRINYDTFISFSTLDAWANFPDFQHKVADLFLLRQARDRIMIGWNGARHAAQPNPVANPLLQDVQVGWLQHYRNEAPKRVLKGVKVGPDANTDYKTLDAAVCDAASTLLDPKHRRRTDLVAVCGETLLHDKYFPLVNGAEKPTKPLTGQVFMSQERLGRLPAVSVPFFPEDAVFVTPLSNLSIYWQTGARRRYLREEPERNRLVNFESSNDAFVVEDYGAGCLIEGIRLPGSDTDPGETAPAAAEAKP
ncbi:phage major capsid protein, P2 family [Phaeovibrio sulfidiphilus]|uniref:Phage major capsid protein, P2 family n=1 Tax=Phaeovibrio sulfidiphilus TaxID=1220600 RepID=A0A8J6YY73_9PROT|nr:phage major capsid protein, P2 family [Phaeovibrio sulfidiphilus]MBE1237872.1 phage major capsid protein, P2 family [Phaeovibrio sulfidiphilus]